MSARSAKSSARSCRSCLAVGQLHQHLSAIPDNACRAGVSQPEPVTTTFWQTCESLLKAPRYEQIKTIKQWFLPIYKKFLAGYASDASILHRLRLSSFNSRTAEAVEIDTIVLRVYTLSVIVMARVRSYGSILDVSNCCSTPHSDD